MATTTPADLRDRVQGRCRDAAGAIFAAALVDEAIAYGVRSLFPLCYTVGFVDLGEQDADTLDITLADEPAGRVEAVEYLCKGWRQLGADITGTTVSLREPLSRTRTMRLRMRVPLTVPAAATAFGFSEELVEVVGAFACAYVLEGYAAARIPYDKYTVTSADDAIAPYEVQNVARDFRRDAEARLSDLAGAQEVG